MQSSHTHCQGIAPSPSPVASEAVVMATPLSVEMPAKSLRNKDRRLVKRLKGLDGLAFSGGNGSTENRDQADGNRSLPDVHPFKLEVYLFRAKESEDLKMYHPQVHFHTWNAKNVNPGHTDETAISSKAAAITAKPVGNIPSSVPAAGMDIRVSNASKMKAIGPPVPVATGAVFPSHNSVTPELLTQAYVLFSLQDERELKRERRKQSNRESARRSRLRKQVLTLSRVEDDAFLCLLDSVLFS
ncbi:hypothetical protein B296_00017074 [Ensete ventricosum]|uniref:BZIP domain-containing protein n=1 Tax=Ensete ventricosum TaxID=4639 RepID=A0A427B5B7_ENSVE|nr:hypothetical protein B296_00017074 [Ensete ventricosum]